MIEESQNAFLRLAYENRLSVRVPMEKKIEFIKICKENNMQPAEAFAMLIDFYTLTDVPQVRQLRTNLAIAISRGVSPTYIRQLRMLYEYLVIFLKRINELHR